MSAGLRFGSFTGLRRLQAFPGRSLRRRGQLRRRDSSGGTSGEGWAAPASTGSASGSAGSSGAGPCGSGRKSRGVRSGAFGLRRVPAAVRRACSAAASYEASTAAALSSRAMSGTRSPKAGCASLSRPTGVLPAAARARARLASASKGSETASASGGSGSVGVAGLAETAEKAAARFCGGLFQGLCRGFGGRCCG